jgi:hypothetical protein
MKLKFCAREKFGDYTKGDEPEQGFFYLDSGSLNLKPEREFSPKGTEGAVGSRPENRRRYCLAA